MALNIIDALVVTLGLDNREFRKRQAETQEDLRDLRDEGKKSTEALGQGASRAAEGFRTLRNETAGFLVVLAGASSIKGLVSDIVASDAATGRLATSLGVSTQNLSAWQIAVKGAGGQAQDANAAFQTMTSIFENVRLRGDLSQGAELAGLGVTDLSDPEKALMQLAKARERMTAPEYQNRLQHLGLTQPMINLLSQGTEAVRKQTEEAKKNGAITEENARQAAEFEKALNSLEASLRTLVRPELYRWVVLMKDAADAANSARDPIGKLGAALRALGDDLGFTNARAKIWTDIQLAWARLKAGDISGAWSLIKDAANTPLIDSSGASGGGVTSGSSVEDIRRSFPGYQAPSGGVDRSRIASFFQANGYTAEQARGIAGGIAAEGGSLGMARNGAFGLGQWRGARQRGLFARYGNAPTQDQQLQYLLWELRGGDPGGASVGRGTTAEDTGTRYLRDFMRPQGRNGESMRDLMSDISRMRGHLGGGQTASGGGATTTTIGSITINTAATDATGIARSIGPALRARGLVYQAGSGMTS